MAAFRTQLLRVAWACVAVATALGCGPEQERPPTGGPPTEWPSYGGDPGGLRHVAIGDITAENLDRLEMAWTYRTGDLPREGRLTHCAWGRND